MNTIERKRDTVSKDFEFDIPKYWSFEELIEEEAESLKSPDNIDGKRLADTFRELKLGIKHFEQIDELVDTFAETYLRMMELYGCPQDVGGRAGDQTTPFQDNYEERIYEDAEEILEYLDDIGHDSEMLEEVEYLHKQAVNAYKSIREEADVPEAFSD